MSPTALNFRLGYPALKLLGFPALRVKFRPNLVKARESIDQAVFVELGYQDAVATDMAQIQLAETCWVKSTSCDPRCSPSKKRFTMAYTHPMAAIGEQAS